MPPRPCLAAVDLAEPELVYRLAAVPNDALYAPSTTTPYNGLWHLPRVAAELAWNVTQGSSSVGVCLIDTGIRQTHEDIAANFVAGWNRCGGCPGRRTDPSARASHAHARVDGMRLTLRFIMLLFSFSPVSMYFCLQGSHLTHVALPTTSRGHRRIF